MFEAVHIFDVISLTANLRVQWKILLSFKGEVRDLCTTSCIKMNSQKSSCESVFSVYSVWFSCENVIMGCICPMQSIFCQMKMISLII